MSLLDWDIDASHWSDPFSSQPAAEHGRENHNSTHNPVSTVTFGFKVRSLMESAMSSNAFYSHGPDNNCEDNAASTDSDSDSFVSCVEELEDLDERTSFESCGVESRGRTNHMGRQNYPEATANRKVASGITSAQTKHQQQQAEGSGVHFLGGCAQEMAPLAVRAKHYVTPETAQAWEKASVTKQSSRPPSAAVRDFVPGGGFPSNDPYYQKYGEPTSVDRAEPGGNSQTERSTHSEFVVTDVIGRGSQASYRQHPSDVAAGTISHSQSGWVDEEQASNSSLSVYFESNPEASGQIFYQQQEVRGNPRDVQYAETIGPKSVAEGVRTIVHGTTAADFDPTSSCVLGWEEEEESVGAPQGSEATYEEPYQHEYQYEWEDEGSHGLPSNPYNTAEASDDGCICQHLMQVLQDWCNMAHGIGATDEDPIASVPDLLVFLKNSFGTSQESESGGRHLIDPQTGQAQINPDDVPVCPEDGFPDLSAQSRCDECWAQYSHINSILQQTASQFVTPLDKETRKAITKANRKLARMKEKIASALKVAEQDNRRLDETVTRTEAHKEQLERAMENHVRRVHERINNYHKIAVGDYTKGHNRYRALVEKEKKKVETFRSHLSDLLREIQDTFTEIKAQGLTATMTVKDTQNRCNTLLARTSEIQAPVKPPYSFVAPRYTDQEIASMVGCITITENVAATNPASQPPTFNNREPQRAQPTTTTANNRDKERAQPTTTTVNPPAHASTCTVNSTGSSMYREAKKDSGLSTPTASMESLDSRSSEQNFATSSLGQKDKLSAYMASASSVASSARSATRRKTKKKEKGEIQTKCHDPYGYLGRESTGTPGCKPQTITIKHNSSPNITRLIGPEPAAIAPTDNGLVWMVYADRSPQLHCMEVNGNILENMKVGGNTVALACLDSVRILMAAQSHNTHLRLLDEDRKQIDIMSVTFTPVSISLGQSGVVVAGRKALCWVSLSDWETQWIVPEKDSPLKHVCSTAVTLLQDQELICAADKSDNAVHFYLKNVATGFSTLRPYYGRSQGKGLADTLTEMNCAPEGAQFIPVSVSAHPAGFVAILDSASNSVHVLNVEHSHDAVSVIPGSELYRSGIPSVIAFGFSDSSDAHLKLWSAGKIDDGKCFVCHTPLKFQY